MPDFWFWGLLASIILLAFALSLKTAGLRFELKMRDKVINGLWKQIDILNQRDNQGIPNKQKLNVRRKQKTSEETNHSKFPFHEILKSIAKYHSQEIPATPKRIANDIGLDPEITLAYMWKYHNEQFISFRSGGKKPGINTSFFLSPKALEEIDIIKKQS